MTQHEYNVERDAEEWAAHMIKRVQELKQQNAELLAACISAKNTMLASVDNSYAMADTIELLESTIAKAGDKA